MIAAPVTPVTGEVMSGNIQMWSDFVSASPSLEKLPDTHEYDTRERTFLLIYHFTDGQIRSGTSYAQSLQSWDHLRDFTKAIHVLDVTDGRAPHDFDHEEIDCPGFRENPWFKHDWFKDNFRRWVEMVPRASVKNPGQISYFQDSGKRARNIRTPIKPGRWLSKYFSDILSQEEIQKLGIEYETEFADIGVTITQDADEIEAVYRGRHNGSCMQFKGGGYGGSEHPARVYAGPDLGIAYLGASDYADARCLVWPEKKIYYPKWYGDGNRLENVLRELGWKAGYGNDFRGARIQRIKDGNKYVVPYVDTHSYAGDNGTYLVLGGGDIYLRSTDGIVGEDYECDDCGREVSDEDDLTTVYDDDRVCEICIDDRYFYCEEVEAYHLTDNMAPTPEEYTVSRTAVRGSSEWFYCSFTELYYPRRDYERVELLEGGACVEEYADENGFYCDKSQQWSLETSKRLELTNDKSVHLDSFDNEADLNEWLTENTLAILDPNTQNMDLAA